MVVLLVRRHTCVASSAVFYSQARVLCISIGLVLRRISHCASSLPGFATGTRFAASSFSFCTGYMVAQRHRFVAAQVQCVCASAPSCYYTGAMGLHHHRLVCAQAQLFCIVCTGLVSTSFVVCASSSACFCAGIVLA